MSGLRPGQDGFYHPSGEDEIRELIFRANREGVKVRVRGSAHSVADAIYTDGFGRAECRGINIYLDKMIGMKFDDARMQVTVQAGCHLGKDPSDPARTSTIENSLFYQIDRRGWALLSTGGIIHQTVAGFLSTGSSGGSLMHSVGEQIVVLRIMDGRGNIHELSQESDPEVFSAAGVSMGLLDIIIAVTGLTRATLKLILAPFIKLFVGLDGKKGPERFWDVWWHALPMDNNASDALLPTEFTELWLPVSRTQEVMRRLRDHYARNGLKAAGPYACEIYATKASEFWLSPAYGEDVVKTDFFWFGKNKGDPAKEYYPQFWDLLKDMNFRLHWGKYLSLVPETGPTYIGNQYSKWKDFMTLREEMDPTGVFLTEYWRLHLGIRSSSIRRTTHELRPSISRDM